MIDANQKFELLIHKAKGDAFEDLFVRVMSEHNKSFRPVKAYGSDGDGGNDGWVADTGSYYQCYAPNDFTNNSKGKNKLFTDFKKLKQKWEHISEVKEFYFVINDKFDGSPRYLIESIKSLKEKYQLEKAEILNTFDLKNILFSLDKNKIEYILGFNFESKSGDHSFYINFVDKLTELLHLNDWTRISDNLIIPSIENSILEDFVDAIRLIKKTDFPNHFNKLNRSIIELGQRVNKLVNHFYNSDRAYLVDNSIWRLNNQWRKKIVPQDEFQRRHKLDSKWICNPPIFSSSYS